MSSSLRAASEPITLQKCLEAFTREEELGEDEKYYCASCKTHQLAIKKLQIWRLPPVLVSSFSDQQGIVFTVTSAFRSFS